MFHKYVHYVFFFKHAIKLFYQFFIIINKLMIHNIIIINR
jgi:hypothetical protein